MNMYEMFKASEKAEREGIELRYGDAGTIRVTRAGPSNKDFMRVFNAEMRPYQRQYQTGTLDTKLSQEILIRVFAKTVVVGWEGVKGADGKEMAFSVENCIKLFTDLPDLFLDVQEQAMKFTNFVAYEDEEDAKN